jgi:hypothetical protein
MPPDHPGPPLKFHGERDNLTPPRRPDKRFTLTIRVQ